MSKTNYIITLEVKTQLADGEYMCLQKVYPRVDGKNYYEDQGYRFIRALPNGSLKAQRGQAQIENLSIMKSLIEEMINKESPTVI
jgi:hypothetical protein